MLPLIVIAVIVFLVFSGKVVLFWIGIGLLIVSVIGAAIAAMFQDDHEIPTTYFGTPESEFEPIDFGEAQRNRENWMLEEKHRMKHTYNVPQTKRSKIKIKIRDIYEEID